MITIKEFNDMLSIMRTVKDFDDNANFEMAGFPIKDEGVMVLFSENGVNIRMDIEVATLRNKEPYKRGCDG